MSLAGALANASAALTTAQYQVALGTTNVSNASTTGYTSKTYTATAQTTTLALTQGEVSRVTDVYLQKALIASTASAGYAETVDNYMSRYDSLLGDTSSDSDIASLTTALTTALSTVTAGTGDADAAAVVQAAGELADGLRTLSSGVQSLRADADAEIASTVDEINQLLKQLGALNDQLVAGQGDATALQDARDTALQSLAALVDVTTFTDSAGRLNVYAGGQMLVGATVSTLSFSAAASVSASSTYPTSLSGVSINGRDVTASLTGGELGALIALRDTQLPAEQSNLDALAAALIESVNDAAAGAASTSGASLTSTVSLTAATPLDMTGALTVVQYDADGVATAVDSITLDSLSSVGDLVDALNALSGVTATLVDGELTLSSADGGLALDSAATASSDGRTLSQALGFNAVFTGTDASSIRLTSALSAAPDSLAVSSLEDTLEVGKVAVASGGTAGAAEILSALTTARDFDATQGLSARTRTIAAFATEVLSAAATRIATAATSADSATTLRDAYATSLSNSTGVNLDEQAALVSLYQQQYEISAQLMSAIQDMFDALVSMAAS